MIDTRKEGRVIVRVNTLITIRRLTGARLALLFIMVPNSCGHARPIRFVPHSIDIELEQDLSWKLCVSVDNKRTGNRPRVSMRHSQCNEQIGGKCHALVKSPFPLLPL